jgi:HD-like signal output (HDOD) protein
VPEYRDRVVQVLTVLEGLPTVPRVIHEVLRLTADDDASASDLAELIGEDQSLTARLLRVANSAYFGHSREVATVSQAVVLVGFGRVRSAALAVAAHHALRGGDAAFSTALWRHALITSEVARHLTAVTASGDPDEAAVSGLLHDVGKLALETICPVEYALCRAKVREGQSLLEAETAGLGITHAEIGSRLLMHWNLPLPLVLAAAGHHMPEPGEPHSRLVSSVHLASAITNRLQAGAGIGGCTEMLWGRVSEPLAALEPDLEALCAWAEGEAERASHFLDSLS